MLLGGWFRLCLCRCHLKVVQMGSPLSGLHGMTYHSHRKKLLGFLDFSWWRGEIAVHGAAGRNLIQILMRFVHISTNLSSLLSCWSLRIDNFADVHATAEEWVAEHPVQPQGCFSKDPHSQIEPVISLIPQALVSGVEVADLAELTWSNQLRLAVRMRWTV